MGIRNYKENSIDAFGDAYEYLMSMYASNAGKSGGEFFTPQDVSELLTRIAVAGKAEVNKVYDPACGSGSLLLKAAKILGKENVRQGFYGQEVNLTTYNLCRINMFLHDIDFDKFDIAHEDTLVSPQHWDDEPFEVIVSNPPYSIKVDYHARCVPYDEIAGNNYNLSVSTYVEAEDTREVIDIVKLNAEIREIVAREQVLRDEIDKIIAEIEVG